MSRMNFERMSLRQIDELIQEALKAKEIKRSEERNKLRELFAAEAAAKGFALAEIAGGYKTIRSKATGKHTYRNPLNGSETWTGRGRRPRWLEGQLKAGKSLDAFRV